MTYRDLPFEVEDLSEGSDDYRINPEDFRDLFVIPSDWTLSTLRREMSDIIDLDPEFQRRSVWTVRAKSRFIESLALGIPIPQILLAESRDDRGRYLVLDGKQRLLTILEFFEGKFWDGKEFRLSGLDDLPDLNRKNWFEVSEQLPDLARSIEAAQIRTAIIRGWRSDDVLYEIFHRLNSGSVGLSPMELRMALIRGPFIRAIVQETSRRSSVHDLLRLSQPDKRMRDVELVIRHMAFSDGRVQYKGNLKKFLDEFCMLKNKEFDRGSDIADLSRLESAIGVGLHVFGHERFCRKYISEKGRYESQFNRAIFDVLSGSLVSEEVARKAQGDPNGFVAAYEDACAIPEFRRSVEVTTKSVTATTSRFKIWFEMLNDRFGVNLNIPNIAHAANG
ncbi:DUF262 domain-containing protein [Roseivivax marinus]|uniref:DUF262 domain-containing protein n=1 Tax=Roseivivax marinus TaxID=1379903 RepID=UPI00273F5628|nr:DUF262 domain-containing protein [Roseivivax marinus]